MSQQPDIKKKKINQKLRFVRMRQFLTIEAAAERIGVSPTTYTRWEQGYQTPHLVTLGRLCDAFNASAAELGFGSVVGYDEAQKREEPPLPRRLHSDVASGFSSALVSVFADLDLDQTAINSYAVDGDRIFVRLHSRLPDSLLASVRMELLRRGYKVTFRQPPVGTLG